MEKQSKRTKKRFVLGLLAALWLICANSSFSQAEQKNSFTRDDAEKLMILPKDDIFFTNKEAQFILKIPNILPSDVQTELPNFPEGIVFNSSKRGDYFSQDGSMGAEIDLWFTFRKTGSLTLPPLIIYVKGRRYSINFKTVEVYENPRTILPRMTLVFDSGEVIGEETKKIPTISLESNKTARFTLYLQYAIQAQQFAWSIPKDSIFTETKRYNIENSSERASDFSTKKVPVADFEWTPFASGQTSLPEIRMMATAYSGRSIYLTTPECLVTITPQNKSKADKQDMKTSEQDSVYAYAWAEETSGNKEQQDKEISPFDCAEIARLRSQERRSFINARKIRAQRIAAEEKIGLQKSENEPLLPIFFILLGTTGILAALGIILFLLKKRFEAAMAGIAAIAFIFVTSIDANVLIKKHGIIVGGEISPVPEESAMTKTAVSGGSRVLIKEEVKDWYYIVYNENGGWIRKENLAAIK